MAESKTQYTPWPQEGSTNTCRRATSVVVGVGVGGVGGVGGVVGVVGVVGVGVVQ